MVLITNVPKVTPVLHAFISSPTKIMSFYRRLFGMRASPEGFKELPCLRGHMKRDGGQCGGAEWPLAYSQKENGGFSPLVAGNRILPTTGSLEEDPESTVEHSLGHTMIAVYGTLSRGLKLGPEEQGENKRGFLWTPKFVLICHEAIKSKNHPPFSFLSSVLHPQGLSAPVFFNANSMQMHFKVKLQIFRRCRFPDSQ